jgi:hypothetical protein
MAWKKGEPREKIPAPDFNDVIRDNNYALEAALNPWLEFETGGTQTGHPRQGSARPYCQDAAPTIRLDSEYFDATDLGCLWIKPNSDPVNQISFLSAADGAGTQTWTPISTEIIAALLVAARVFAGTLGVTGDFAVNTDKFTVAAVTGNVGIAGSLDPTSLVTTKGGFKDEDNMASDSATAVASQQSIKKFVEDKIDAAVPDDDAFGSWASKSNNTVYQAATDGFVVALNNQYAGEIKGYTDGSNPPTTQRAWSSANNGGDTGRDITMPVRKGDYWKVTGGTTIYWLPIGA